MPTDFKHWGFYDFLMFCRSFLGCCLPFRREKGWSIYIASASPAVPCARSSRLGMAAVNLSPSRLGLPSGFNGRSKRTHGKAFDWVGVKALPALLCRKPIMLLCVTKAIQLGNNVLCMYTYIWLQEAASGCRWQENAGGHLRPLAATRVAASGCHFQNQITRLLRAQCIHMYIYIYIVPRGFTLSESDGSWASLEALHATPGAGRDTFNSMEARESSESCTIHGG